MMSRIAGGRASFAIVVVLLVAAGMVQAKGPRSASPTVDLPALIECRSTPQGYGAVAFKVVEPGGAKELGWTEVKQPNSFVREFLLPAPITVFGQKTRRIIFGGSGVLAVLDGVEPKALAAKLGLQDAGFGPSKLMFARIVKQEKDSLATTTIRLNVSTIDSHPGKTLVGCEYVVEVS